MPDYAIKMKHESLERLENLIAKTQVDDIGEVISNALRIYEHLIECGEDVKIVYQKGNITKIERIFINNIS